VCRGVADARHRSPNRSERAVERELAETKSRDVHAQLPARAEDREGDCELEPRPLLAALSWREIHRDPTERKLEP